MASPTQVYRLIRNARREAAPPVALDAARYRPQYEAILTDLHRAAGDEALDEVAEWAIASVERRGRLPSPDALRERARAACEDAGVEVPDRLRE